MSRVVARAQVCALPVVTAVNDNEELIGAGVLRLVRELSPSCPNIVYSPTNHRACGDATGVSVGAQCGHCLIANRFSRERAGAKGTLSAPTPHFAIRCNAAARLRSEPGRHRCEGDLFQRRNCGTAPGRSRLTT